MKKPLIYFLSMSFSCLSMTLAFAQSVMLKGAAEGLPRGTLPAELLIKGWLSDPFIIGLVNKNLTKERVLQESVDPVNKNSQNLIENIKQVTSMNKPLGIIFLDKDSRIFYEEYNKGATKNSQIIGYSMSKSMTSLAVGKALCEGYINSLDDLAQKYNPSLAQTAYGNATVKELLTMSSAGMVPNFNGQPVEGVTSALLRYRTMTLEKGFIEFGTSLYKESRKGEFVYKNFDTYALGAVVSNATKMPFHDYFSKSIWSEIGASLDAAWLVDKNGATATADGFGAALRDWGRVALYINDQLDAKTDSCFQGYLSQATSAQIENKSNINRDFKAYGYQFWVNHWMSKNNIMMLGYAGQMVIMNPKLGKAMVVLSSNGGDMKAYINLFNQYLDNR